MSKFASGFAVLLIALFCIPGFAQNTPQVPPNAVVQGTVALIQLTDRLDTHTAKAGDHFQARLAEPMTAADGTSHWCWAQDQRTCECRRTRTEHAAVAELR